MSVFLYFIRIECGGLSPSAFTVFLYSKVVRDDKVLTV